MKPIAHSFIAPALVLGVALIPASLPAASVVVLEGFEAGLGQVAAMTGGGRPALDPPGVTLVEHTSTGADDTFVTEGKKALRVDLSGSEWWSSDFQITLSDTASDQLRAAQASPDVARYVLRWDYSFPPSGTTAWMNSQVYISGVAGLNDQLDSNNGRLSHSFALDTLAPLPAEGPIVLQFAQNFDATADPFDSLSVYVDNVRLIDTYAAGAKAVTHVLQSFESADDPTGGAADFTGWGGGTRTTYSQHTASDAGDVRVTHGNHSLKVDYANPGTYSTDFTLPFAGTRLAEILKLDLPAEERPSREDLLRYTLRFDVIYPPRADDWPGDWMSTSFHTFAEGFPVSQGGTLAAPDTLGYRKTVSITLDQITWSDTVDPKPQLMFIANGAWGASGTSIYYDNFRLIDTGTVDTSPAGPRISSVKFDAAAKAVTLVWQSEVGKNYAIDRTDALGSWPAVQADTVAGEAGTTTYTGTVPASGQAFFRIRVLN